MMSSPETTRWIARRSALAAMAALVLAAAACDDKSPAAAPDSGSGSSVANDGPPAVLLVERVFTPAGRQYVLSVLPAVPSAAVDRSASLVLDSADVELFDGRVYVRDRVANTMTRYQVSSDLKLVMDGQFSFAPRALGPARYNSAYLANNRAYLMDSTDWRLIGWNPADMTLSGEVISIANMKKDPALTGSISAAVPVGGRLIAAINWEDFTNLVLYPGSGALVIDPNALATPGFLEDSRVGGGFRITAGTSGEAYLTGTVGGDVRKFGSVFGGAALPESGLLKLTGTPPAFDGGYLVDAEAITHSPSVAAVHRINDTTLLAQIYDPALALPATLAEFRSSLNFEFVTIDPEARTFAPVAALPRGGQANAGNHVVDGVLYIQIAGATSSTVYAVSAAGITEAFPVPAGDVWFLARVR